MRQQHRGCQGVSLPEPVEEKVKRTRGLRGGGGGENKTNPDFNLLLFVFGAAASTLSFQLMLLENLKNWDVGEVQSGFSGPHPQVSAFQIKGFVLFEFSHFPALKC